MSLKELYKKRMEENGEQGQPSEKSGGYTSLKERYLEHQRSQNAETVAQDIATRTQTWLNNHNNYLQNHNQRFSGRKGTYEDAYVSDSSAWADTVQGQKDRFDQEYNNIITLLDQYGSYYDSEWVDSVRNALNSGRTQQDSILAAATQDKNYWGQFGSSEGYDSWKAYQQEKIDVAQLEKDLAGLETELEASMGRARTAQQAARDFAGTNSYTEIPTQEEQAQINAKYEELRAAATAATDEAREIEHRYNTMHDVLRTKKTVTEIAEMPQDTRELLDSYLKYKDLIGDGDVHKKALLEKGYTEDDLKRFSEVMDRVNNQETMQAAQQAGTDLGNSKGLAAVGSWLLTFPANLVGAVTGFGQAMYEQAKTDLGFSGYKSPDANGAGFIPQTFAGAIRSQQSQNILGDEDDSAFRRGVGTVGNYVYQGVSSAIDSGLRILASGGNSAIASALASAGSFSSTYQDIVNRGGSADQAMNMAIASAGLEYLTEKFSVDNLLDLDEPKTAMQFLKNALIQGGVEVSEEEASFLGNLAAEAVFLMDDSAFNQRVWELSMQMPLEDAKKQAYLELGKEALDTAIISFISGSAMAGAPAVTQGINRGIQTQRQYTEDGREIMAAEGGVEALKGLSADIGSVAAPDVQKQLNKLSGKVTGDTASGNGLIGKAIAKAKNASNAKKVGKLLHTTIEAVNAQSEAQLAESMVSHGMKQATAEKLSGIIVKSINGTELTETQVDILESLAKDERVVAAMKDTFENQESTAYQLWQKVADFEEMVAKENTAQTEDGVQYSLRAFNDGKRFVDVQARQDEFDGLSVSEMNRKAKAILTERFAGKVIGIDNRVFVNGDSINEYLHPSKSIDIDTRKAKLTASSELDNLLDAGTQLPNEPDGKDGHVHPDAIDFSYFKTIFKVGSEYFEGVVNIKNIKRGKLLKDITKIRNITKDIVSSYGQNPKSNFLRDASMNSISKSVGNVNGKDSAKSEAAARKTIAAAVEDQQVTDKLMGLYRDGDADPADITAAFEMGYGEFSVDKLRSAVGGKVTETIRKAYESGKQYRAQEDAKRKSGKAPGGKVSMYYLAKDGKLEAFRDGKAGKLTMTGKQSVAVKTADFLHRIGIGGNVYFFESYEQKNAKGETVRVFKDKDGNIKTAPNGIYYAGGDIYIDINAGMDASGITLTTLAHELVHYVQQWSGEKYRALAEFLAEQYEKKGVSAYAAVKATQKRLTDLRGENVTFAEAYHEWMAESMSTLFNDGKLYDKLLRLKKRDSALYTYLKKIIDRIARLARKHYGTLLAETPEAQFVQGLSVEAIEQLQQKFAEALVEAGQNHQKAEVQKDTAEVGGGQMQDRAKKYDFSKPFNQQVDDYSAGVFPRGDTLVIGGTPNIYQSLGFNALPMTINTTHVDYALYGTKDADHFMGEAALKQLPKSLEAPIAVFVSQTHGTTSVIALLNSKVNGNQTVVPVVIDGFGFNNNIKIDSNAITSAYGKASAIKQLYQAARDEANGKFALLYANKKEAISLLQNLGHQLTAHLIPHDGFYHSIRESNSPVKPKFENVTETQQFKRWFGDWQKHPDKASKVVNADGTPRVMYHGTSAKFMAFDKHKTRSGVFGKGFYFTPSKSRAGAYGSAAILETYLSIRNPYIVHDSMGFTAEDYRNMQKAFNIQDKITDQNVVKILKNQRYDGIIAYDGKGNVKEIVAFEPNQIKSAPDNIGTFDGSNPDIRYQDRMQSTLSRREAFAQVLDSVATDGADRLTIQRYRDASKAMDEQERKLNEINAQIREITHGSGKQDTAKLRELRLEASKARNRAKLYEDQLAKVEHSQPYQKMIKDVREASTRTAKRPAPAGTSEEVQRQNSIVDQIRNALPDIMELSSACTIDSSNATHYTASRKADENSGAAVFRSQGGYADRKGFGRVVLGKKGAVNTVYHGNGPAKQAAFPAIKSVIEKGVEIGKDFNHDGKGFDTVTFAAPVNFFGKKVPLGVVVKVFNNGRGDKSFYIHEICDAEGNYIKLADEMTGKKEISNTGVVDSSSTAGVADSGISPKSSLAQPDHTVKADFDEQHPGREISEAGTSEEVNAVGAAAAGFDTLSSLEYEYGNLPEGENAVRDDTLPKSTNGKDKVSLTARTVKGAKVTPDDFVDLLDKDVVEGGLSYIPISNNATTKKAIEYITRFGWEDALAQWKASVEKGDVSAETTAVGALLLNNAAKAGDKKTWLEILHDYQKMGTNLGQALQAMRILKKLDPDDSLYMIRRSVAQMVKDMGHGADIRISSELEQKYLDAKTDAERDAALDEIAKDVANQIPRTKMEMWTAIRYLNMLGNLRTQVRNVTGNIGMMLTKKFKDTIAAGLETIASAASGGKFQRTKAVTVDPAQLKAAREDFSYVEALVLGGGKYSDSTAESSEFARKVQDARKILPKGLEHYRRATNWAMDTGDAVFSKAAYARALAGWLKANGIKETDFSKIDAETMDKARAYAVKEAQEATFRDYNALSKWVAQAGRGKGTPAFIKGIAEGVMPFRKTPANILVRAVEYSPIGFVNSAVKSIKAIQKGTDVTGADVINSWAKTLTGTGLFALGMLLHSVGMLVGGPDDDEEKDRFESMSGWQNYALVLGDTTITIDFLSPAAIPLFMGAQFKKLAQEDGVELKDIEAALVSIADPLIEMSMLQGVNDTLENIQYAESSTGQLLLNAALSYLTQGVTNTMLGQIERTFEDQRMTTYVDKDSAVPAWLQRQIGKASAKIPGWDYQQIPYINAWGEEEESPELAANAAENMLSPSYISKGIKDKVFRELNRLNDVQAANVYPSSPAATITYTGTDGVARKNYALSADDWVALAKKQGQTARKLVEDMVGSRVYADLPDVEKGKAISKAYEYARELARQEVLPGYPEDFGAQWMAELKGDIAEGILAHITEGSIKGRFVSGELSAGEAMELRVKYSGDTPEEAAEKVAYWDFQEDHPQYAGLKQTEVIHWYDEAQPAGIALDVYYGFMKQKNKCKGVDKNGDGKADSGTVKKEVLALINGIEGLTYKQKKVLKEIAGVG